MSQDRSTAVMHPSTTAPRWTEAEDQLLLAAHRAGKRTSDVAREAFPHRSVPAVANRLVRLLHGHVQRPDGLFTARELAAEKDIKARSESLLRAMLLYGLRHGRERRPEPGMLELSMAQVQARARVLGLVL